VFCADVPFCSKVMKTLVLWIWATFEELESGRKCCCSHTCVCPNCFLYLIALAGVWLLEGVNLIYGLTLPTLYTQF